MIDQESLNRPSKDDAETLQRPNAGIEHQLPGFTSPCDYNRLEIIHRAFRVGIRGGLIDKTHISLKDLVEFKVVNLTDDGQILDEVRKFRGDITQATPAISIVTFKSPRVDYSEETILSPRGRAEASNSFVTQLEKLKLKMMSACGASLQDARVAYEHVIHASSVRL